MAKNTKISKIKETEATAGDITGVTAGTNLNGGGTTGDVTVNLDSNISVNSILTAEIGSNTDINLNLDADGDGSNAVKVKDHAGTVVCTIDESGNLTVAGNLSSTYASKSSGGNILVEDSGVVKSKTTAELKTDLTLNNVENKSSATIRGEIVDGDIPNLATSKITSGTFDAARIPTLNQDTTGTATNATKQIVVTTHNFQMANTTGTFFYVPFNNLNESSAGGTSNYWTRTVPPYAGTIKKIAVRSHTSLGTSCELRISKITDTTDALTGGTHVDNTSIDISSANVSVIETMNTNSFAAGDAVGVALKRSAGTAARVVMTIAWEYTT